jgi:hypothetical protein
MIIKSVKNFKFKDAFGIFVYEGGLALYEEGKGFVSLDGGKTPYIPCGGRKALKAILASGFYGEIDYIKSIA